MKKVFLMAGLALVSGVEATTIVELTQAAPDSAALSSESMANYDCFIVKGGTLSAAMGRTPETSLAGVEDVVAYLNDDFASNYQALLAGAYDMVRDVNRKDFRNASGSSFGERFGLVVYNPVDGSKAGVDNIAYYRVFNLDNLPTVNDLKPNSGYWSDWQTGSAVPEPTSALLLIAGVAGLALRRKGRRVATRQGWTDASPGRPGGFDETTLADRRQADFAEE